MIFTLLFLASCPYQIEPVGCYKSDKSENGLPNIVSLEYH